MNDQPSEPVADAPPTKAPETAAAAIPTVPASWPGAFGAYKHSKKAVKLNLGTIVILWLLTVLVGGIIDQALKTTGSLINLIVGPLFTAALALTFTASVRDKRLSIGEAFNQAFPLWLKAIGLTLLVGVSLFFSFLLLVIPFFFVLPRLSLAMYFLVDKKMGVMDAYKASWNATKGFSGKVWGIIGVHILMVLLMVTVIGIPFSIYFLVMYSAVFAVLYEFLGKSRPAAAPAAAAPEKPEAPAAPVA